MSKNNKITGAKAPNAKIAMVAVITWRSRVYVKKDYSIVCCNPDDLRRAFNLVARIQSYHQIDVSYFWKQ